MATRSLASRFGKFATRNPLGITRNYAATAASEGKIEFLAKREAIEEHAKGTERLWKNISLFVCVPALIIAAVNSYRLEQEHKKHPTHAKPEHPLYQYQRIRIKPFPWGDGDKTLFHNPNINQ